MTIPTTVGQQVALIHRPLYDRAPRVLAVFPDEIVAGYFLARPTFISDEDGQEEGRYALESTDRPVALPKCPTGPETEDGTEHTIIGCGSTDLVYDGDVFDCGNCGICFDAQAAEHHDDLSVLAR